MNYFEQLTLEDLNDLLTFFTSKDIKYIELETIENIKSEIKKRNN
jgi:hypothetical protein